MVDGEGVEEAGESGWALMRLMATDEHDGHDSGIGGVVSGFLEGLLLGS